MSQIKGYRGSSTLKKTNQPIEWTDERKAELLKCKEDPIYFSETYMSVVHVDRGLEKINLYDYQREIITSVHDENAVAAEMARQSGKCVKSDTFINIRNKSTGELVRISIGDFYDTIKETETNST